MENSASYLVLIDIFGIGTGLISTFILFLAVRKIGGKVGSAFGFIMWGIVAQTLAFAYTLVFTRLELLPALPLDLHHGIMAVGLILFVFGALKASDLSK